jgi:hypothetical protein
MSPESSVLWSAAKMISLPFAFFSSTISRTPMPPARLFSKVVLLNIQIPPCAF